MWRPFLGHFVNHSFEGYSRKSNKMELDPLIPHESKFKFDLNLLYPYKQQTEIQQERSKLFPELKKKVKSQRLLIKKRDEITKQHRLLKEERNTHAIFSNKEKKKQELSKLRGFINRTYRKHEDSQRKSPSPISKSYAEEHSSVFITNNLDYKYSERKNHLTPSPLGYKSMKSDDIRSYRQKIRFEDDININSKHNQSYLRN